ncbi:MAG: DNA gyrase inhibitor YacG [Planctomycetia bacterium]|nr:DNA gyrase inhibitor YacG [Planctomycetia bacterium]
MVMASCPYCHRRFDTEQSDALPFCSRRCRMADLNGWLSEEYSVPVDIQKEMERQALGEDDDACESDDDEA